MIIFIEDKPIRIINRAKIGVIHGYDYDAMIDARLERFDIGALSGHVIILNADSLIIQKFFELILSSSILKKDFLSVTFTVENENMIEKQIRGMYKVVKAAGGVVFNEENKILMIFRLKRWDLPKGKCDDGEKSKVTAVREVNEECNINVLLGDKLCTTWHTYEQDGKPILKRTKWYKMTCVDDSKMKPQKEENIEDIRWMDEKELQKALVNSYSSIRFVIDSLKK
jgi:8-oxo-dGTP pyrophosphatase MutT (NUDIX family)